MRRPGRRVRRRRRRGDFAGPGGGGPCPPHGPGPAHPRFHPDERPHAGGRAGAGRAGLLPGDSGPRAEPFGDRAHRQKLPHRGGGIRTRRAVHERFRPVLHERLSGRPQRQPGRLRRTLPPALRGGWLRGLPSEFEGPFRRGQPARSGRRRCGERQDRGTAARPGIRGRRGERLPELPGGPALRRKGITGRIFSFWFYQWLH